VIDMALLSVIRRWHLREGMPIREIERRTGLSRNTIRKYLRAGEVEPKFKVPDRPSKLDPFAEKLSGWLRTEAVRSRKQRRTVKQMHADLVVLGYDPQRSRGLTRVCSFELTQRLQSYRGGHCRLLSRVGASGVGRRLRASGHDRERMRCWRCAAALVNNRGSERLGGRADGWQN
jgi:transposase